MKHKNANVTISHKEKYDVYCKNHGLLGSYVDKDAAKNKMQLHLCANMDCRDPEPVKKDKGHREILFMISFRCIIPKISIRTMSYPNDLKKLESFIGTLEGVYDREKERQESGKQKV